MDKATVPTGKKAVRSTNSLNAAAQQMLFDIGQNATYDLEEESAFYAHVLCLATTHLTDEQLHETLTTVATEIGNYDIQLGVSPEKSATPWPEQITQLLNSHATEAQTMVKASVPTEKLAVLSTSHLSEAEAEYLPEAIKQGLITGMTRPEGFLVHVRAYDNDELPHLSYVLGYLSALGFDWVLFDSDGEAVEALRVFDW